MREDTEMQHKVITITIKMAADNRRQTWQQIKDEGTKIRRYKCNSRKE